MRETGDTLNPIEFPPKTGATSRVAKGTIARWGTCDPAANGFQPTTDYILGPGIPGSPATGLRRWGGGGEQLTEMAMDENGEMAWQHTNVWAAGQLLATYDRDSVSPTGPSGPHYHLSDWLGTRRVQTDASGAIEATCTSLPYGDALNCIGPASTTEHHFTGKERDQESGNDYFGERYYASSMGRFMSPDPFIPFNLQTGEFQAWIANPQHWGKYAYALNNPLKFTDPTGMTETIYYQLDKNLTDAERKFFYDHKDAILNAIGAKLKAAGIVPEFRDGSDLSQQQEAFIRNYNPRGLALLTFADTTYADWDPKKSGDEPFGGYNRDSVVVLMGNLLSGSAGDADSIFRLGEVGAHELGHSMGLYSRPGWKANWFMPWNHDLMNEEQGRPVHPEFFDMSIPQNQKVRDQIYKIGVYVPFYHILADSNVLKEIQ